tara:strand:+ start:38 stop:307 length:270 start_codon:yes stop_codon:yes gene_type:complete
MLTLEPIDSNSEEEDKAYNFLIEKGFEEEDVKLIQKCYEKESVKFSIKTFNSISLNEMKEDLKKYKESKYVSDIKNVCLNFLNKLKILV